MSRNDNYIDPNYVDPALLAQYDEEKNNKATNNYDAPVYHQSNYDAPVYHQSNNDTQYINDPNKDLLDQICENAMKQDASDIHLMAGCKPMIRAAKQLTTIDFLPELDDEMLRDMIKKVAKNNPKTLENYEETKSLDLNYKYMETRFRVNVSSSMDSPTLTMRLIKQDLPPYSSLNLPPTVKEFALKSQGLILVTGKPGSGKSTTMNSLVNEINESANKKILMLENPIEFVHRNKRSVIVQKEVSPYGDVRTFHEGVVNSLREDCDVLIVGEIRDKVTMDATIEMAETGHLVIGTLHTNSCAETIDRIINFYPTEDQQTIKFMLANALKLVVSQRMLRGNYGNLIMIPEILIVDDHVGGLIKKDKFNSVEVEDIMQSGREKGNYSLVFSLADAIFDRKITLDQAQKEVDFKRQELLARIVANGRQRKFY